MANKRPAPRQDTLHTLIPLPRFSRWLDRLADEEGRAAVSSRIAKARGGDFGKPKLVHRKERIWEMRIDAGPGYRVYFTHKNDLIYLLLAGGDKDGQARDIRLAIEAKKDYFRRGK
jgi:putative addiction module killer protein